ncbi:Rhs element Vgr protein [Calothrix sp. NIES-2100]|nr:Rhs element Vgr protein [Calothrix sp. NIES-2100]
MLNAQCPILDNYLEVASMEKFFGKYRGQVTNSQDPLNLGRIQVRVAAIYGEGIENWALPATPYAGKDIGFFTVPPVGSNVWVEFEGGDTDYPIWSGCFWGEGELPQAARVSEPDKVQVLKTNGITFTWNNLDNKGLFIEVKEPVVDRPLKMVFNPQGIEINNNNELTIKITADIIELKNRANSTVTLRTDSIQVKEGTVEVNLTSNQIELKSPPGDIKLQAATGIELSNPAANTKLTPTSIELTVGAASIKMSPATVNVNNGALEVI